MRRVEPASAAFREAVGRGRAQHVVVGQPDGAALHIVNLYGWDGATEDGGAMAKTRLLVGAVLEELRGLGVARYLIIGDLNTVPEGVPELAEAIAEHDVVDLGGPSAEAFEARPHAPTCWGHNAARPTRRDVALASAALARDVRRFVVEDFGQVDVHAPVRVEIRMGAEHLAWHSRKPKPFVAKSGGLVQELTEVRRARLEREVDTSLGRAADRMAGALVKGDVDGFWEVWSSTVERAMVRALAEEGQDPRPFLGRGQPRFSRGARGAAGEAGHGRGGAPEHGPAAAWALQSRRMRALAHYLAKARGGSLDPGAFRLREKLLARRGIAEVPQELVSVVRGEPHWPAQVLALKKAAHTFELQATAHRQKAMREGRAAKKERLEGRGGLTFGYRILRKKRSVALAVARREDGSFTLDPLEIDHLLHRAWGPVFEGNAGDRDALVGSFVAKYYPYLDRKAPQPLPPWTGASLLGVLKAARASAAGLDGWRPEEMGALTEYAAGW